MPRLNESPIRRASVRAAAEPDAENLEDQVAQLQSDLKSITDTLNTHGPDCRQASLRKPTRPVR